MKYLNCGNTFIFSLRISEDSIVLANKLSRLKNNKEKDKYFFCFVYCVCIRQEITYLII